MACNGATPVRSWNDFPHRCPTDPRDAIVAERNYLLSIPPLTNGELQLDLPWELQFKYSYPWISSTHNNVYYKDLLGHAMNLRVHGFGYWTWNYQHSCDEFFRELDKAFIPAARDAGWIV